MAWIVDCGLRGVHSAGVAAPRRPNGGAAATAAAAVVVGDRQQGARCNHGQVLGEPSHARKQRLAYLQLQKRGCHCEAAILSMQSQFAMIKPFCTRQRSKRGG